ncbi:MAG: hypothetical protein LBT09_09430 [Planctomycetaceae bacterium]|nr:hypothetical protein [Planctomycetaceae bacterium]
MNIRISNTIVEVEHAALADNEICNYLYSDVVAVLGKTTPKSLSYPQLASAKISYENTNSTGRLMFYVAWLESLPSIDGICVHLPSESFITKLRSTPYRNDYGGVLHFQQQLVFETDIQWEKRLKTIDLLETQPVYVSLVRNKKILKEKIELKHVPLPSVRSKKIKKEINEER